MNRRTTIAAVAGAMIVIGVTAVQVGRPRIDPSIALVNAQRSQNGVAPLRSSPALRRAARELAAEIVANQTFDELPTGEMPGERARRHGYPGNAGCSIALSPEAGGTWATAVEQWMADQNRQNLLGEVAEYRDLGTATLDWDGRTVYVAVFGDPD